MPTLPVAPPHPGRTSGTRRVLTLAGLLVALLVALLVVPLGALSGPAHAQQAAPATVLAAGPVTAVDDSDLLPEPAEQPAARSLLRGASIGGAGMGAAAVPEPAEPPRPSQPGMQLDLGGSGESPLNSPVSLVLLLGAITLIPALLIMTTAFTRIVIVLGFVRSALGTNGIPPNQVVIGLALFLSLFVMAPTFSEANEQAVQPFSRGEITQGEALERGMEPFRAFMLRQVRDEDLATFVKLAGDERPAGPEQVETTTLVPAFILSELRTAFLIGFVIFIPFIIIDLIVSAALSAMGMVMLPPVLISLPFKLLLFVAANGWSLVVESLLSSFAR